MTESITDSQHRACTGFANIVLERFHIQLKDLVSGFHDGSNLILLVQGLNESVKNIKTDFPTMEKNPNNRFKKLHNVQLALDYLRYQENLPLTNIAGENIVDGNIKTILGLIWLIVLHYQISDNAQLLVRKEESPKKMYTRNLPSQETITSNLIYYLNTKLDGRAKVNNLTVDWRSGRLLVELLEAFGVEVDVEGYDPLILVERCLQLAEEKLGIPALCTAEDIVFSSSYFNTMIYLSLFKRIPRPPAKYEPTLSDDIDVQVRKDEVETTDVETGTRCSNQEAEIWGQDGKHSSETVDNTTISDSEAVEFDKIEEDEIENKLNKAQSDRLVKTRAITFSSDYMDDQSDPADYSFLLFLSIGVTIVYCLYRAI